MKLLHYGDWKGGGTLIAPAPDSHIEKYRLFLSEELKLVFDKLPRISSKTTGIRTEKKANKKGSFWILPPARGTNKTLVPAPGDYPCNICEFAQYNHLCQYERQCTAYSYWVMNATEKLNNNGSPNLKKAFLNQFGKKKK